MSEFILILIFLGLLIGVFGSGVIIGHVLDLDKFIDDIYNRSQKLA